MKKRSVWMRLGVTIEGTPDELETIIGSDDCETSRKALLKIIKEGRFCCDGNSYIPETCIEDYNVRYGTTHEAGDYDFEL